MGRKRDIMEPRPTSPVLPAMTILQHEDTVLYSFCTRGLQDGRPMAAQGSGLCSLCLVLDPVNNTSSVMCSQGPYHSFSPTQKRCNGFFFQIPIAFLPTPKTMNNPIYCNYDFLVFIPNRVRNHVLLLIWGE